MRARLLQSAPADREDGWATLYILRGSQVLATNRRLRIKAPFGLAFCTCLLNAKHLLGVITLGFDTVTLCCNLL